MAGEKVWFVTGCSKGLGKALVEELLNQGYSAAGTSRDKKNLVSVYSVLKVRNFSRSQ